MTRWPMLIGLVMLAACEPARTSAPEAPTVASARACRLPARIPAPVMERVDPDEVVADRPIRFHMLAVSWMPETCRADDDGAGALACEQNRFGWTLHGLWPNSEGRPYPRYCRPATEVRRETIRANLCRTPSVDLVQHEWAAHGTCGWATPEAYFAQAAELYDPLRMPDPETLGRPGEPLTAGRLRAAIHAANLAIPEDGVYIAVGDNDRLREVRLCHDLAFKPRACPEGLGAPDEATLRVEPIRP